MDNIEAARDLIVRAFEQKHEEGDSYNDCENTVAITFRKPDHTYKVHRKSSIKMDTVKPLLYKSVSSDPHEWDGNDDEWAIFMYQYGIGIVHHHHWWGPTFSGNNWTIDICQTKDWDVFDRVCLTDSIRDQLGEELDNVLVELILLRGEKV